MRLGSDLFTFDNWPIRLPLSNLFRPVKLDRVLVENIGCFFFSQCFQNQCVIVILIGPRRAGGRQVGAEHERPWIGRVEVGQRGTDIEVYSSEAGGLHPHTFFREFEQRWETRFGETEMVDADRRQRHQGLIKIRKLGRIDIQLGVPADQFMNAPRKVFQVVDFFGTAALDVETDGTNPRAVELLSKTNPAAAELLATCVIV